MERILIGVAWPYANGPLHLGHVAGSLLPPDIFARFHCMRGNEVLMVSGSDEHGTPITVKAEEEGTTPQALVDRWHKRHVEALDALDVDFDLFTRTSTDHHQQLVHEIFRGLDREGYIEERVMRQPYDPQTERFLPDRYVEGTCPHCGFDEARGDQCDDCGKTLDAGELEDPRSALSEDVDVEFRDTTHAFFLLSRLQDRLEDWFEDDEHPWRDNVEEFTRGWLEEGLEDRPVTRDIDWGIDWIDEDPTYRGKSIYVWFEAFCGYFTASVRWAEDVAGDPDAWKPFWERGHDDVDTRHYYFLAKDNIPFHTILWPGILAAYSDAREAEGQPRLELPYDVPANEYLNLSGKQFSKSRGVGIWVHEILDRFETDAVRYYLAAKMPETKDTDWTWEDFLSKVNDELVAAYGNFVHRSLTLTDSHVGHVPEPGEPAEADRDLVDTIREVHEEVTEGLDEARFQAPLQAIMRLAREGNCYIDRQAPWQLDDEDRRATVLHHCLRLSRALAILTAPYLPDSAQRLWRMLGEDGSVHEADWSAALEPPEPGSRIGDPEPLFEKLDEDEVLALAEDDRDEADAAADVTEDDDVDTISFDDFQDVDLRTGTVTGVRDHPDADKLYVLEVDLGGDERQLVAGLKGEVAPDTLEGLTCVVVANLEPATIRGVESQGMLLAAESDEIVTPLTTVDDVPEGSDVL